MHFCSAQHTCILKTSCYYTRPSQSDRAWTIEGSAFDPSWNSCRVSFPSAFWVNKQTLFRITTVSNAEYKQQCVILRLFVVICECMTLQTNVEQTLRLYQFTNQRILQKNSHEDFQLCMRKLLRCSTCPAGGECLQADPLRKKSQQSRQ